MQPQIRSLGDINCSEKNILCFPACTTYFQARADFGWYNRCLILTILEWPNISFTKQITNYTIQNKSSISHCFQTRMIYMRTETLLYNFSILCSTVCQYETCPLNSDAAASSHTNLIRCKCDCCRFMAVQPLKTTIRSQLQQVGCQTHLYKAAYGGRSETAATWVCRGEAISSSLFLFVDKEMSLLCSWRCTKRTLTWR